MTSVPRWCLAPNPSLMTLDGTRTYVVGREQPVVIDPGPAIPEHVEAVLELIGRARPGAILLTHGHADHAASAAELSRLTGAPVWMGRAGNGRHTDRVEVHHWAEENDGLETDEGLLRIVSTPGHAPEHVAIFWEGGRAPAGGAAFVGDLLLGEGDTTIVAPPEGDLSDYLESLRRMEELSPKLMLPAHGPPITDPLSALERYRRHREHRIEQVRRAMAELGTDEAAALVGAVYGAGLPAELRGAATGSIRAVVKYLKRVR